MNELSLVVPVYNEGENIARLFAEISTKVAVPHEIIVVYDFDEDNTLPVLRRDFAKLDNLRLVKNPKRGVPQRSCRWDSSGALRIKMTSPPHAFGSPLPNAGEGLGVRGISMGESVPEA